MRDTIYREDAIDAIRASTKKYKGFMEMEQYTDDDAVEAIEGLSSAQPKTRTFVELVIEYPDPELCTYKEYRGKPYYSIKYIENGETYVGYGTYKPEVLSQFLREYFIPSAQPDIIHCGECKYYHDSDGCFFSTATIEADGFCHWAERKEGEANEAD